MSKKLRILLLVLVMVLPLALAGCGGDDDKDEGDSGESISLSQTFESEGGISVKYPEGWVAQDADGQVVMASSAAALDAAIGTVSEDPEENDPSEAPESGEIFLGIMVYPMAEMGMGEDATLDAVFDMIVGSMSGEGAEAAGDPEVLKIGDYDARRVEITGAETNGDAFMLAFVDDGDTFVMVLGMTAPGEGDDFNDVVTSITETVAYTAPAAE